MAFAGLAWLSLLSPPLASYLSPQYGRWLTRGRIGDAVAPRDGREQRWTEQARVAK